MSYPARGPVSGIDGKARRSVEQGPHSSGMRPRRRAWARDFQATLNGSLPGRTYRQSRQALLHRQRASAASRRHEIVEHTGSFEEGAA